MNPSPLVRLASVPAIGCAVLILLAGCETDRPARSARAGALPDAPEAKTAPAIPEMEAHGTFFAGQIEAEILLGRAGFAPREAATPNAGGGGRGGGFRGGFGGGGRRGGLGGRGGGGENTGGRSGAANRDGEPVPNIHASNEPPVRLHLRLTNHGDAPVDIEVPDFNSDLGNFVVQPRKISIPAGGSVEAEPMTSRLGVKADEIPLTVTLRLNGRSEKQMLPLRAKPDAASSAPSTPAPAVPAGSPPTP